jgi:hypothetical protein
MIDPSAPLPLMISPPGISDDIYNEGKNNPLLSHVQGLLSLSGLEAKKEILVSKKCKYE